MRMKKGITVAMLVVMVAVLGILTTVTVTSISNSYANSKLSVWVTEIQLVQDLVKENRANLSNILLDEISFDVSGIDDKIKTEQFDGETITSNKIALKEVNLAAIGVDNALYGVHKDSLDIYAYSETTGKVYYLKGMDTRVNVYYTLTTDLKNRYGDNLTVSNLSLISFEQSEIKETSNAVQVTVKIPKTYTNISVTTSNSSVTVGSKVTEEDKYTYLVNTNSVKSNYTITVGYTENGTSKTITHEVKNYNVVTLGSLITGAADYGKTVDYSVTVNGTTYTDWQIYYHNEDYVYLISTNSVGSAMLNAGTTVASLTTEELALYEKFRVGTADKFTLVDALEDGTTMYNCQAVAQLIKNYASFANTTDYGPNVVGAIGGPTIELFAAGWNAKGYTPTITLTTNTYGYEINGGVYLEEITNDGLYVTSSHYCWLASPSAAYADDVLEAGGGYVRNYYYESPEYVRPVVCLSSKIPATTGTTTDYSLIVD